MRISLNLHLQTQRYMPSSESHVYIFNILPTFSSSYKTRYDKILFHTRICDLFVHETSLVFQSRREHFVRVLLKISLYLF